MERIVETKRTLSRPSEETVADVRCLMLDLVRGERLESDPLSRWTARHWEVVAENLIAPWLHKSLPKDVRKRLSQDLRNRLRESFELSARISLFQEASLAETLNRLGSNGIPVVVLKGVALGRLVYSDPALRPMSDIDLLVRRENFDKARSLLIESGYEQTADLPLPKPLQEVFQPAATLVVTGQITRIVDLHRDLWPMGYYRWDSSQLWSLAQETTIAGQSVFVFPLELNLIHCGLNTLSHGSLLRDWLDVLLIMHRPEFNWGRFLALADSLGVMRPLYWILRHQQSHWKAVIPEDVIQNLGGYRPRWLEDRVICGRFRYVWRKLSRFRSIPGSRLKLSYLKVILMPSAEYRRSATGGAGWAQYIRSKGESFSRLYRSDL
ncbi:nucleotidyltransferase family protein [Thermodesulfobacteriota bacterium]